MKTGTNENPHNEAQPVVAGVANAEESPVDVQKLSLSDIGRGVNRLSLGSVTWIAGTLVGALSIAWSGGAHFHLQAVNPDKPEIRDPRALSVYDSGLTSVEDGLSNEQLKSFLHGAKTRIRIVVPWFVDPLTVREGMEDLLGNPQGSVIIYFLDPKSPHLVERGRVAKGKAGTQDLKDCGPSEMLRSLKVIAPALESARAVARIFTYDSLPAAFITQADDKGLLGFHMHTGVALRNPILFFDVRRNGRITATGKMIDEEFNALLPFAREIDLKSVQERAGTTVFSYKP